VGRLPKRSSPFVAHDRDDEVLPLQHALGREGELIEPAGCGVVELELAVTFGRDRADRCEVDYARTVRSLDAEGAAAEGQPAGEHGLEFGAGLFPELG